MPSYDGLFVIWSELKDRGRHIIGELSRDAGIFRFAYTPSLDDAVQRGFKLLPEFAKHRIYAVRCNKTNSGQANGAGRD